MESLFQWDQMLQIEIKDLKFAKYSTSSDSSINWYVNYRIVNNSKANTLKKPFSYCKHIQRVSPIILLAI